MTNNKMNFNEYLNKNYDADEVWNMTDNEKLGVEFDYFMYTEAEEDFDMEEFFFEDTIEDENGKIVPIEIWLAE